MVDVLVSVIIPSYNRFDNLLKAIESVKNQSFQDFEIIVVNDASTDERYYKHDFGSKVKVINLKKNSVEEKGYFSDSIRNYGIENSESKYIAFLDDDDYWMPNKLELQIKKLESSEYRMTCSESYANNGEYREENDNKLYNGELMFEEISKIYRQSSLKKDYVKKFTFQFTFPEVWTLKFLKIHNCIITSSVVVERSLLNQVGNFRDIQTKKLYSDYDCWLGLLSHTDCYYFDGPLLYYDLNIGMNEKTL